MFLPLPSMLKMKKILFLPPATNYRHCRTRLQKAEFSLWWSVLSNSLKMAVQKHWWVDWTKRIIVCHLRLLWEVIWYCYFAVSLSKVVETYNRRQLSLQSVFNLLFFFVLFVVFSFVFFNPKQNYLWHQ